MFSPRAGEKKGGMREEKGRQGRRERGKEGMKRREGTRGGY
jgi:hypothetical protein